MEAPHRLWQVQGVRGSGLGPGLGLRFALHLTLTLTPTLTLTRYAGPQGRKAQTMPLAWVAHAQMQDGLHPNPDPNPNPSPKP